jgi:hypothetical protein
MSDSVIGVNGTNSREIVLADNGNVIYDNVLYQTYGSGGGMFKITGLEELSKNLTDASKAMESLGGELGTVRFDPSDPASIEAAIQEAERMVDERIGPYLSNPIIGPLAESMKEQFRTGVLDRAAAARLEGDRTE